MDLATFGLNKGRAIDSERLPWCRLLDAPGSGILLACICMVVVGVDEVKGALALVVKLRWTDNPSLLPLALDGGGRLVGRLQRGDTLLLLLLLRAAPDRLLVPVFGNLLLWEKCPFCWSGASR